MNDKKDPPAADPPSRQPSCTSVLRESITAALAAAIAAIALWMLIDTYQTAGRPFTGENGEALRLAFERQKDIMQFGLALLGAVTGYCLGRVPAELRAESAQKAGAQAQAAAQAAQTEIVDARMEAAEATRGRELLKKEADELAAAVKPLVATLTLHGKSVSPPASVASQAEDLLNRVDQFIAKTH